MKTRYTIYYKKYSFITNGCVSYIKIVYTDDIYHDIGALVCRSLGKIIDIHFAEPTASIEDCERFWRESGYEKVNDLLWKKF